MNPPAPVTRITAQWGAGAVNLTIRHDTSGRSCASGLTHDTLTRLGLFE